MWLVGHRIQWNFAGPKDFGPAPEVTVVSYYLSLPRLLQQTGELFRTVGALLRIFEPQGLKRPSATPTANLARVEQDGLSMLKTPPILTPLSGLVCWVETMWVVNSQRPTACNEVGSAPLFPLASTLANPASFLRRCLWDNGGPRELTYVS